jgi:hypothetical protein
MSRSKNTDLVNPATRWFRWNGGAGTLSYYDKETKENIEVAIPFQFLVLDKLITISGYSDEDQSGIWSNEIRNTTKDVLILRTKHGIKKQGFYNDVKTVVGAKFCQSLYIAFYDEEKQLQIGNLKLSGCAVSAWIEFIKGRDIYKGAIGISGTEEDKKGATKFFRPVFEQKENVSEKANLQAMELDGILQEYLIAYFTARGQETEQEPLTGDSYIEARNVEINGFEGEKTAAAVAGADSLVGDNDYRVEDDSIPF